MQSAHFFTYTLPHITIINTFRNLTKPFINGNIESAVNNPAGNGAEHMSEEESLINEGKRLRTIEIATRMIESGNVALYDIANYTELPLSKVEDLAEK